MRRRRRIRVAALGAAVALLLGGAGRSDAGELHPTLLASFQAFPGFGAPFALDHNLNTDYASLGGGRTRF